MKPLHCLHTLCTTSASTLISLLIPRNKTIRYVTFHESSCIWVRYWFYIGYNCSMLNGLHMIEIVLIHLLDIISYCSVKNVSKFFQILVKGGIKLDNFSLLQNSPNCLRRGGGGKTNHHFLGLLSLAICEAMLSNKPE